MQSPGHLSSSWVGAPKGLQARSPCGPAFCSSLAKVWGSPGKQAAGGQTPGRLPRLHPSVWARGSSRQVTRGACGQGKRLPGLPGTRTATWGSGPSDGSRGFRAKSCRDHTEGRCEQSRGWGSWAPKGAEMKGPEVSPGDRCQDLHQESGCGWLRSGEARNWLGLDHGRRTPRSLRKRTGSGTHCWTAVARGLRVKQLTSGGDGHGSAQRAAGQRQGGTEGPVAEGVEVAVTGRPQLWATSSTLRGSYSLRSEDPILSGRAGILG